MKTLKKLTTKAQSHKKTTLLLPVALCVLLSLPFGKGRGWAQNIGINATGSTPATSAGVDVDFNTKGLLIPRVALTDVAVYAPLTGTAVASLIVYSNTSPTNGNGEGYYYWSGSKWISIPAPANGPGTNGQVLASQGSGVPPQWSTLSTGGGGPTGCADCITQTAIGTSGTWATCRNSCVAMGTGWRMPTWDEEVYIGSGALGTPAGGFTNYAWTSTPTDARVYGTLNSNNWLVLSESNGIWSTYNYSVSYDCRCVK